MAEPGVKGKTRSQLDSQLKRINTATERAMAGADYDEMNRVRNRWFKATDAYGRLSGDNKLIDSIKDYRPADRHFTSNKEIEYIEKKLKLAGRTPESLNALRNNVVEAYDRYAGDDREKRWELTPWMQSVTAVIDNYMYRRNRR